MRDIPEGHVPPDGEFTQYEDGEYEALGLEWFSVETESPDIPLMVAQKNGVKVGRLRFNLKDGKAGPPMSVQLGEMALLVKAFGGDIRDLPELPGPTEAGKIADYMIAVKVLSDTAKCIKVTCKNGWVSIRDVQGAEILGDFYLRAVDITPKDKETDIPFLKSSQFGQYFFLSLEIVADGFGKSTVLRGAIFSEIMNYGLTTIKTDEGLEPDLERTDVTGEYTAAAHRMAALIRIVAPELFSEGYVHPDPTNLLPDLLEKILESETVFKAGRIKTEKGRVKLNWGDVSEVSGFTIPKEKSEVVEEKERVTGPGVDAEDVARKARIILIEFLDSIAGEPTYLQGKFTEAGKKVGRSHLRPLLDKGLIQNNMVENITFGEVQIILDSQDKTDFVDNLRHRLAAVGVGVDSEDDSDF